MKIKRYIKQRAKEVTERRNCVSEAKWSETEVVSNDWFWT